MKKSTAYEALPRWAKGLYAQTKGRAKKRGNVFDLDPDDYASMVSDKCSLTQIPFVTERSDDVARHYKRPFAPSIDRIDNSLGYTKGNVRIVCVAVNIAMNAWGEEVLYKIAAALVVSCSKDSRLRTAAGRLPKGVKLSSVSIDGPRYNARFSHNGKRLDLGRFNSPEAAVAEITRVKNFISANGFVPELSLRTYQKRQVVD